jgi:hypothetical protein
LPIDRAGAVRLARECLYCERPGYCEACPSGLTCAHYLARLGYAVDLFEWETVIGGGTRKAIPSSLPPDALERKLEAIAAYGVHFLGEKDLGENLSLEEAVCGHAALFLATGPASRGGMTAIVSLSHFPEAPQLIARRGNTGFFAGGG